MSEGPPLIIKFLLIFSLINFALSGPGLPEGYDEATVETIDGDGVLSEEISIQDEKSDQGEDGLWNRKKRSVNDNDKEADTAKKDTSSKDKPQERSLFGHYGGFGYGISGHHHGYKGFRPKLTGAYGTPYFYRDFGYFYQPYFKRLGYSLYGGRKHYNRHYSRGNKRYRRSIVENDHDDDDIQPEARLGGHHGGHHRRFKGGHFKRHHGFGGHFFGGFPYGGYGIGHGYGLGGYGIGYGHGGYGGYGYGNSYAPYYTPFGYGYTSGHYW